MGNWNHIRLAARRKRAEVLASGGLTDSTRHGSVLPARRVLDLAAGFAGVPVYPVDADDPILYGSQALLYSEYGETSIYFNAEAAPWYQAFCQAHELGHLWLHEPANPGAEGDDPACGTGDVDIEASDTDLPVGARTVEGYGPRERREREANVFAREFLLPADALREWYESGLNAQPISLAVGLPQSLVYQQLAYALLAPPIAPEGVGEPGKPGKPGKPGGAGAEAVGLDESQRRAAYAEEGPLLIEAGPGTGKTRTLIARVEHLLGKGVPPTSILALTFSNKAAEEMRARVAAVAPGQAPRIWMGTFHSFGLELLSKHGTRIGLPAKVRIIDQVEALLFLERSLGELRLEHYLNLYEPGMYLRDILGAISRAKDELAGPERYEQLARAMFNKASAQEEVERAEKALEVARVYALYEAHLRREGLVDFGDLIALPVKLLREHPGVREQVRRTYRHILVDEYQDVNRASGLLLRELAGDGKGLWAVGDARQAIYRFRGAAPENMHLFAQDYPGARVLPLEVNYRSVPGIVDAFSELAPQMRATAGREFAPWRAHRASGIEDMTAVRPVLVDIAADANAEADALAARIEEERARGVRYGEQAVLCRSHTMLARIGGALEARGVPVLYLGDLFEREEVRDMLALVALSHRGVESAGALLRVARFPEYDVPSRDVRAVLSVAAGEGISAAEAVSRALDEQGAAISDQGRAGLALLMVHLESCAADTAWKLLARYLFGGSGYLRYLPGGQVAGLQQRLALFQFLQFTHEYDHANGTPGGADAKDAFLRYVRALEIFGEERALRQVPDWASRIDAVRLLTVHASKGLEFRTVYLPGLGSRYFPASRGYVPCPPPEGLIAEGEEDRHEAEEECLFFVALSRAKDRLCLSRALRYGKQGSHPSRLLMLIAPALGCEVDGPPAWSSAEPPGELEAGEPPAPGLKRRLSQRLLEVYMECPRRFFYEQELGLGGNAEESAYVRFHRCVYEVIAQVRAAQDTGEGMTLDQALEALAGIWEREEMSTQVHAELYYEQAVRMLRYALEGAGGKAGRWGRPGWEIPLRYGSVTFRPDRMEWVEEYGQTRLRLQRLRTGRQSEREKRQPVYALYHEGARRAYPHASTQVQTVYLSAGMEVEMALTGKQVEAGLKKYDEALAGIMRGNFHAEPDDRRCPRCAHYFTCPVGELE